MAVDSFPVYRTFIIMWIAIPVNRGHRKYEYCSKSMNYFLGPKVIQVNITYIQRSKVNNEHIDPGSRF